MQLIYEETKTELNRDTMAFNKVIERVNEISEQKKKGFSHLIIDGVDVYEDHEQYINERINEIMQIEIVALTVSEMIWETMGSVTDYLERAIPAIRELAMNVFVEFTPKTWGEMEQLTDGMNWMHQFVEFTRQVDKQPVNWDKADETFKICEGKFAKLLAAIEAEDLVKVSDILKFGIVPTYEEFEQQILIALKDTTFVSEPE